MKQQTWTIGGSGYAVIQNLQIVEERVLNNMKESELEEPSLYKWIDLGLPSGTLWADRNVGANAPEEYGLYFAWGETEGYTEQDVINGVKLFNNNDYKFKDDNKYDTDSLVTLELSDDAAYVTDNTCRMPTKADLEELCSNVTLVWTTNYNSSNVSGIILTSKINGNSIFIPAAGYCAAGVCNGIGSRGTLFSSSLDTGEPYVAYGLFFNSNPYIEVYDYNFRYTGNSVRPVKQP